MFRRRVRALSRATGEPELRRSVGDVGVAENQFHVLVVVPLDLEVLNKLHRQKKESEHCHEPPGDIVTFVIYPTPSFSH